jgi:hypothetical protein
VHPALELAEMAGEVLAFAVSAELIPGGGWIVARPWPIITNVSPYPCRGALPFGLHPDRGVIRKDRKVIPLCKCCITALRNLRIVQVQHLRILELTDRIWRLVRQGARERAPDLPPHGPESPNKRE